MSQAPLPLLTVLPQLDPAAASSMRPPESGQGFSAVAALFGLDPAAAGAEPGGLARMMSRGVGGAARPGETRAGEWDREAGAPGEALLVQWLGHIEGGAAGEAATPQPDSAVKSPGERPPVAAAATLPRTVLVSGDGRADADTPMLRRADPILGSGPSEGRLDGAGSRAAELLGQWLSSRTGIGRDRAPPSPVIAGKAGGDSAAATPTLPVTATVPEGRSGLDKLAETIQDLFTARGSEPPVREGLPELAGWSSRRTEGARATSLGEPVLAARGDFGLQTSAVAAQPPTPSPAPSAPMSAAAGQTFEHVALMVRQGVSEARLQLKPAELGRVDIRIEIDGNEARVQMHVQQAQVREALEQLLPRLREALAGQGVELSDATVDHSGDQAAGEQGRAFADSDASAPPEESGRSGDRAESANAPAAVASRAGLLDAYA